MLRRNDLSRRVFLERLGAGVTGGAALSQVLNRRASAQNPGQAAVNPNSIPWAAPPKLVSPNILIILVDQMRWPCWLSSSQLKTLNQTYLPNISGKIRNNAYVFQQYFAAATACVPSRATLLTGLYSPGTAMFDTNQKTPPLNPAFPTWGHALPLLNSGYQNNVWWFGKWHLSDSSSTGPMPLARYGFNTGTIPGGLATNTATGKQYYITSPNGGANEGLNGGSFQGQIYANDAMIAADFINWLHGQTSTYPAPPSPSWCTTVSLINPHDIAQAPGWFQNTLPPAGLPTMSLYFPSDFPTPPSPGPNPGSPQPLLTAKPSPWNWENLGNPSGTGYVGNKPSYQYSFLGQFNATFGKVTDWVLFLNQYYWLQNYVDQQVGNVLAALNSSPYASNTIVIFASDHGDYGGSHGLHDKSGAVYDESLHVPFYIQFPGQSGYTAMNQMCSSVDFFGLICDLASGGTGTWRTTYPDLASRQSIWKFLYANSPETRTVAVGPGSPPVAIPYILHTVDESSTTEYCPTPAPPPDNRHIVCLRTKYNAASPSPGAKLAVYSHWPPNATCWDTTTPQEFEFYDYTKNQSELGNDYGGSTVAPGYLSALGTWGPPPTGMNGTGLIGSELNPPLVGTGTDGKPLSQAQATAQQAYLKFVNPCNA